MLKIVGVVLVLGSAAWFGIGRALHYYRAVSQLRSLHSGVEILKCEINYSMQTLPQLCRATAARLDGPVALFFAHFGEALEQGAERDSAAGECLNSVTSLELPPDAKMALLELCSGIGRYDLDGENRGLQLCEQRIKGALERAEAEKRPMARNCTILAFCTGLALVILMV